MKLPITAFLAAGVLSLFAACSGPVASVDAAKALGRNVLADGPVFSAGENPFIANSSIYHPEASNSRNSSDPAAVWAPTPEGYKLLLVTSSDMETTVKVPSTGNYYPMDKTFLYVLDPLNGNNTWRDFGAILAEKDIPWADDAQDHLWAPDIDFMGSNYFVFVPARVGATSDQRIAVFTRSGNPFSKAGSSVDKWAYSDYIHITTSGGTAITNAYDPGVFHLDSGTNVSDYYLSYCSAESPTGRAHIAKFNNAGLTQATELGQFTFTNNIVDGKDLNSTVYMEGPDLLQIAPTKPGQEAMIHLQFAAKFVDSEQEYIGYAYKSKSQFVSDPVNGWTFGGWIQRQIDPNGDAAPSSSSAEWTNHATTVAVPNGPGGSNTYYYLYQYSQNDTSAASGQMRQISMRMLHVTPDLLIQGVSPTGGYRYMDDGAYPFDGLKYPAQTADIGLAPHGFPSPNPKVGQISYYINNPTATAITGWSAMYYFNGDAANGSSAPSVDSIVQGAGMTTTMRWFGGPVYAVEINSTGTLGAANDPATNGQVPSSGDGYAFRITYGNRALYDRTNDWSVGSQGKAVTQGYGYTDTDHVPLFSGAGRLVGLSPKLRLTSAWASNSGRTLTSSTEVVGGEHVVVTMPAVSSWATQDWELEPVPGTSYVRIKENGWGNYLKITTQNDRDKVTVYPLQADWWSEQWLIVPIAGTEQVRIQSRWSGRYLTRGNPNDTPGHDRDDYVSVFVQNLNNDWESQRWTVAYK